MALAYLASKRENVTILGKSFFVDILSAEDGRVSGVLACDGGGYYVIRTDNAVIATGGIGQIYKTSTNPLISTGDGIAAAMRAGARLNNIEFIQFHPTGLYDPKPEGQAFLISEAVRGEGGILKNKYGEEFMDSVHALKSLAPRDIVARAIFSEMERTGEEHVYLDVTCKTEEFLSHRFPTIFAECKKRGINIAKDLIPVCPVQHYLIGGVEVDLSSESSVPGLYVCGETSSTGVHGANRLASNSMLECLVFGRRAASSINAAPPRQADKGASVSTDFFGPPRKKIAMDYSKTRERIQTLMNDCCGVRRNAAGLTHALNEVSLILAELEGGFADSREYLECLNIATVAKAILRAALARKESVGAHYREDHQQNP